MSAVIIVSLFALTAVAIAVLEIHARRVGSRIPSLGDLSAFVMDYEVGKVPVGRIAVLGFWWWVGWHFFAR